MARALSLLGSGVSTEQTAAALGVTPSAISQLLADQEFADQVAHLRYENLQSHNRRDDKYNDLEDDLLKKLKENLSLIMRPEQIMRALAMVNNAKRRGQSAPEQVSESATILTLVLPTQIVQKFETNANNQVISTGEQSLHTMPSSTLLKHIETTAAAEEKERQLPTPASPEDIDSEQQVEVTS